MCAVSRARRRGLSRAGRGPYDANVVGSRRSSWSIVASLLLACASGSDDKNLSSGLSVGSVTAITSATNPYPDTTGTPTSTFPDEGTGDGEDEEADDNGELPTFVCGNGVLDPDEECEGADLDAQTCDSFGFDGGTLACTADCRYDTSKCNAAPVCGDGKIDPEESCDCKGGACTPAQLANLTCMNFDSPKGVSFGGGALGCTDACTYDIAGCTYCGDNIKNGTEECEGGNLGGATCQSLGFDGGTLTCNVGCTYNSGTCESFTCGDGQCQATEDPCVCPEDCPEDPNTCSACECGGQGGPNCWCDFLCLLNGDCCLGGPC